MDLLKNILAEAEEFKNKLKNADKIEAPWDEHNPGDVQAEVPIAHCSVCDKDDHPTAKHQADALSAKNNLPVKESESGMQNSHDMLTNLGWKKTDTDAYYKHPDKKRTMVFLHPKGFSTLKLFDNPHSRSKVWNTYTSGTHPELMDHLKKVYESELDGFRATRDGAPASIADDEIPGNDKAVICPDCGKRHARSMPCKKKKLLVEPPTNAVTEAKAKDPWRHVKAYTKPYQSAAGSEKYTTTYTHPEGDRFILHDLGSGKIQPWNWTHFDKNGKKTSGKGIGNLQSHITTLHNKREKPTNAVTESKAKVHGNYDNSSDNCQRCGKESNYLMGNRECMRCYQSYAHNTPPQGNKKSNKKSAFAESIIAEAQTWGQEYANKNKLSREHPSPESAAKHVESLQKQGVKAWTNNTPDGKSHVFWMEGEEPTGTEDAYDTSKVYPGYQPKDKVSYEAGGDWGKVSEVQTSKRFMMKDGVKHRIIGMRDGQPVTEPVKIKPPKKTGGYGSVGIEQPEPLPKWREPDSVDRAERALHVESEVNEEKTESEDVLKHHGWKPVTNTKNEFGPSDTDIYNHPDHPEHAIHFTPRNGNWRHYNGEGRCVGSGFTGSKLYIHLKRHHEPGGVFEQANLLRTVLDEARVRHNPRKPKKYNGIAQQRARARKAIGQPKASFAIPNARQKQQRQRQSKYKQNYITNPPY